MEIQQMGEPPTNAPVPLALVKSLRQLTNAPWMECKLFLSGLSPVDLSRFVLAMQNHSGGILHDPIEDDPSLRPIFLAVCEEVDREVQEWRRQQIARPEKQLPDFIRIGFGLCHRAWARIKELLRERHGMEWWSPREMNPWVTFD